MTVPVWQDALGGTAAAFVADLVLRGFEERADGSLTGPILIPGPSGAAVNKPFTIKLSGDFPFSWPEVFLTTPPAVLTWHLNPNGELCLFRSSDNRERPWETVDGLFARVAFWHEQNRKGWPSDPGDPDLDRYFERRLDFLVAYDSEEYATGHLAGTLVTKGWRHVGLSQTNRRSLRTASSLWWFGVDVGVLDKPIWDWSTLRRALPSEIAGDVESLGMARNGVLLVHYQRREVHGTRRGAVALFIEAPKPARPTHRGRVTTAPVRNPRAEPDAHGAPDC